MEARRRDGYLDASSGALIARKLLTLDGMLSVPPRDAPAASIGDVRGAPGVVETASGHRFRVVLAHASDGTVPDTVADTGDLTGDGAGCALVPVSYLVPVAGVAGGGGAVWTWLDPPEFEAWVLEVNEAVDPVPPVEVGTLRSTAYMFLR